MGLLLFFANQQGAALQKAGRGVGQMVGRGADATTFVDTGRGVASGVGRGARQSSATPELYPSVVYQVAFGDTPLTLNPAWDDLSARGRGLTITRGRSYEFDRMETGTAGAALSNRDSELSPANSSSSYAPIRGTRPVRVLFTWEQSYPAFRGITEGYPQAYPNVGTDAVVGLQANDLFYALNNAGFTPGSTTLTNALAIVAAGTSEAITVATTALPMPQVVPFDVILDEGTHAEETATVTAILNATQYQVERGSSPQEHLAGSGVTTRVVSFDEALSGTRIQQVLERIGFDATWYDLDPGQSIMAGSPNLADTKPLEHINLIAEAEFGRFFVSREGLFTFRDRHSAILDHLTPAVTFRNVPVTTEIPYRIEGVLEHSEDKLFNRARITIPSGQVVDIADTASINEHFERLFEREWPYADYNDAVSAANFVLARSAVQTLRLPRLTVHPANAPSALWPLVLAREIGDRARFRYQPDGGGDEIDQEVIIEGIGHDVAPQDHSVHFQLTEADPNEYWILGTAGYGELGETTWVGF